MITLKSLITKYPCGIHFNPDAASIDVAIDEFGKCDIHIKPFDQSWDFNSSVEIDCFWYYGCLPKGIREEIETAFATTDYEHFCKIRDKMFNQAGSWCVPKGVSLVWQDTIIGWIDFIDEFIFNNIDFQECEHG